MNPLLAQPSDADGPVFSAAWEAQAFALVVVLHERGLFTWQDWTSLLAEEIRNGQSAGDLEPGSLYYHHWLNALERIVALKNIASLSVMKDLAHAWQEAALHTPHGKPVAPPLYRDQVPAIPF